MNKAETRAHAKAALDDLLSAAAEQDEGRAEAMLNEALRHLSEAAGIPPEGTRLGGTAPEGAGGEGEPAEVTSLSEALAFASGKSNDNPLRRGGLLDRMGIDADELEV